MSTGQQGCGGSDRAERSAGVGAHEPLALGYNGGNKAAGRGEAVVCGAVTLPTLICFPKPPVASQVGGFRGVLFSQEWCVQGGILLTAKASHSTSFHNETSTRGSS